MIRIWKLGDHKQGYLPSKEAVDKLITILESRKDDEDLEIVWDSMIEVVTIDDNGNITRA